MDTQDRELEGRTVLVAGMGVSGRGMAQALEGRVARVITVDEHKDADLSSFDDIAWDGIDMVCTSPVFDPRTPFILEATRRGIPVVSEVELAWLLRADNARTGRPAPWIGITGTNGKTSTTEMVSAMLTACGLSAPAVGNIGRSLSAAALDPSNDVLCVELSSFQLHFTHSLELHASVITNIAADHLDWHGGMERYAQDKAKVFDGAQAVIAYNAQDARVSELSREARTQEGCMHVGFTLDGPVAGQVGVKDGWIVDMSGLTGAPVGAAKRIAALDGFTHLQEPDGTLYPHLLADAMAAIILVASMGVDLDAALDALRAFRPGGHRIEEVARLGEGPAAIRFVDDSKATNAHAARASLESFAPKSVVWIVGGLAKGATFEELVRHERGRLQAAVVIGKDQGPFRRALESEAPDVPVTYIDPQDNDTVMERAVRAAGDAAHDGDVVLMAPACASMDQFVSYADRGDRFAAAARRWVESHARG